MKWERRLLETEGREMLDGGERLLREEVTKIVARWTGIPVQRLVEGEREKRLRMQDILHRRVVAQDEAVGLVADAVAPVQN